MLRADLVAKYKQRLQAQLSPDESYPGDVGYSYSQAYQVFKQEQIGKGHIFYEKLCSFSGKLLKVQISPADLEKVDIPIKLAHLAITPQSVYSFTYFIALLTIAISAVVTVYFVNFIPIVIGLVVSLSLLFYLPTIPKKILTSWRARASDQLVLAVLYAVIFLEHTSNLEQAVRFVAEHLPPPLSIDFMKILWDIETKKYSSITDSLSDYTQTWRGWDDEFVDSVELLESSLYEGDKVRRQEILDKSIQVILDGTQDHMLTFAHNLQSPMESLHMLGVVLPVMGLVMLPMIGAFMGASIKWEYLVVLYNILLPLTVYAIGTSVLQTRPAGSDTADVYKFIQQKYSKPALAIGKLKIPISPLGLGALTFALLSSPGIIYFLTLTQLTGDALRQAVFGNFALFSSLDVIASAGLAMGAYYWWSVQHIIKVKKTIEAMEDEFAASAFVLGERLLERTPVEVAFSKVASTQKGEIAKLYQVVDYNLRQLGTGLKDAIFNPKYGALTFFPSATIKSAMSVLVEGSKKSPETVGKSMLTISQYMQAVRKVTQRLQDLLADTLSSMSSQAKVFVPIISGIVVGLAALTTTILQNLGNSLQAVSSIGGSEQQAAGLGAGILDIFQIQFMIPPYVFQFIVGAYVLQLVFVLSSMISGIIYGHDEIEKRWLLAQNFLLGTVFYIIVTSATVLLFGALAAPITQLTFG